MARRTSWRAALASLVLGAASCTPGHGPAAGPAGPRNLVAVGAGRPSLSIVEREGDARGAVAIAVTTAGIAPDRGAVVAIALKSLVEHRLAARGVTDVGAVGGWDGWWLRVLVASPKEGATVIQVAQEAMLSPVGPKDSALPAVARKIEALAHRPLPDRALVDVSRCTGEAYGAGDEKAPDAPELEAWRRAAHGLGRVAIATVGEASLADAVAAALARGPAWPRGVQVVATPWPTAGAPAVVYDASGEIAPGAARIVVTARTGVPERAVAAAAPLGDPRGPLASRLAALDTPARIRSVVATAHVDGGCIAATLDLSSRDLLSDAPVRIATAAALARQELTVEVADVATPVDLRQSLIMRASDPRDAAERAAWWALAGQHSGADEVRTGMIVGVAAVRDGSDPGPSPAPAPAARTASGAGPALGEAIRTEIVRAARAWQAPLVEARTRVERGQGEAWVLLASTCGTLPEASRDAGTGAAVAMAATMRASESAGDARVEPFVVVEGIGVLAHGPARDGESTLAHARRLGDLAARAFAADALDSERVARARAALLARGGDLDSKVLAALGGAIAPGRPSWIEPWGTFSGVGSASDDVIAIRAAAIRAGPLRVAVLANLDSAQADAAVRAVDRWVARRPGQPRVCPPIPTLPQPRAGTYAVEVAGKGVSEALLAVPLPAGGDTAVLAATWIAAALDGPDGMLARALRPQALGDRSTAPLAVTWSAAVVGVPRSPALVLRVVTVDASLDAAVAQVRAVLDRLRLGAFREDDRSYATEKLARAAVAASLDPRTRIISLWRGETARAGVDYTTATAATNPPAPTLEALRAFASSELRDDALVIVAGRPGRNDGERPSTTGGPKGTIRESTRQETR